MTAVEPERGPLLTGEEQAAMDAIGAAMQAIHDLGLRANGGELAAAVHVLQGFVVQHMLQRIEPGRWGVWFDSQTPSPAASSPSTEER